MSIKCPAQSNSPKMFKAAPGPSLIKEIRLTAVTLVQSTKLF